MITPDILDSTAMEVLCQHWREYNRSNPEVVLDEKFVREVIIKAMDSYCLKPDLPLFKHLSLVFSVRKIGSTNRF